MRFFSRGEPPHADWLVVGLGNPGDEYAGTRHNVGYQVANRLAKRMRAEFSKKAADARIAEGTLDGQRVAVARPGIFMNDSGHSVRRLLQRYRLDPSRLLVVYDDVDLPLGRIRVRPSGGPGTHNGMRSVVAEIGSDRFPRVPLGIARPDGERPAMVQHVLSPFEGDERVLAFPERETMPYELSSPSREHLAARLLTLWRLARAEEPLAVVVSLRALLQHTLGPDDLGARSRAFRAGERLAWNEVAEWLFALGYEPVTEVTDPGTFARRGGILDIFPITDKHPPRIELVGDEIESLRRFDPATQRSLEADDEVVVLPARELVLARALEAADALAGEGWASLEYGEELAPWRVLVDRLRAGGYVEGMEAIAPLLGARGSLLDHLPEAAALVLEETAELELAHDALEGQAEERRDDLAEQGLPVGALPPPYVERSRVERFAESRGSVRLAGTGERLRVGWGSAPSYAGRLDQFLAKVAAERAGRDVIASPQAQRLAELLGERDVQVTPRDELADTPPGGTLTLLHLPLAEGFVAPDLGLRLFTDAELFGFRKPRH